MNPNNWPFSFLISIYLMGCTNSSPSSSKATIIKHNNNSHISDFVSVEPTSQNSKLVIPNTHNFQVIINEGDTLSDGKTFPKNPDFTGYLGINNSSTNGYLSVNSESNPGGVSVLDINFNANKKEWQITNSAAINFSLVGGTAYNCSGAVTPWNTIVSCEEHPIQNDVNNDGFSDNGWCVELDPLNKKVIGKLWALGNMSHENICIHPNNKTVYFGSDSNPGYLYKFIANQARDLKNGKLFVYQGNKSGLGKWILLKNETKAECNSTLQQSMQVGATIFNGVEDVEIGPDGNIYFAVKNEHCIYRLVDKEPLSGDNVNNCRTFAGNMSYAIKSNNGISEVPWGTGNDNLVFDKLGNLWVTQDGDNNYIWVIMKGHTQSYPKVKLFGISPFGAEPTGITFTPDNRFMFLSIQHPAITNMQTVQYDAISKPASFNKDVTIVIGLKRNWN